MDFVTITDHNTLAGSLAIAHLPGTFLSCELDTWFPEDGQRVHVVALGIDEATFATADAARENVHDLVACLREAGVTHYLAHPLFDMSGSLTPDTVERMLLLFNVLEGRNGARTRRSNGLLRAIAGRLTQEELEEMAERQGIAPYGETPWRKALTGGSDDHSGLFAASAYTEAGGDGTPQGFLRAIAAGDCTHRGIDGDSRTLAHSIYAASFWKIREILRLDEQETQKRALGLLRKGFGRVGRDVPVLEKTVQRRAQHGAGPVQGRRPARPLLGGAPRARDRQPDRRPGRHQRGRRQGAQPAALRRRAAPGRRRDGHAPARAARAALAHGPQAPAAEPVRGRHGRVPRDPLLLRLELPDQGPAAAGAAARVLPRRAPAHAAREGRGAVRVAGDRRRGRGRRPRGAGRGVRPPAGPPGRGPHAAHVLRGRRAGRRAAPWTSAPSPGGRRPTATAPAGSSRPWWRSPTTSRKRASAPCTPTRPPGRAWSRWSRRACCTCR